jgi:hypothetical protein
LIQSSIILSEEPKDNDKYVLWHQNATVLGQGATITKLKTVIEELIIDNDIKSRVEDYHRLRKQLSNHEKIDALTEMIEKLYNYVHGGGDLGGFGVCELCDPNVSAPDL